MSETATQPDLSKLESFLRTHGEFLAAIVESNRFIPKKDRNQVIAARVPVRASITEAADLFKRPGASGTSAKLEALGLSGPELDLKLRVWRRLAFPLANARLASLPNGRSVPPA